MKSACGTATLTKFAISLANILFTVSKKSVDNFCHVMYNVRTIRYWNLLSDDVVNRSSFDSVIPKLNFSSLRFHHSRWSTDINNKQVSNTVSNVGFTVILVPNVGFTVI